MLGGTSGVIINSGGTLLLSGTGDRVNDAAGITLAGGTFHTGGLSETVGILTLTADSFIDFGAGSSVLTFANSAGPGWGSFRLRIYNWSGSTLTGGGTDQLRFANNGLTPGQLSQIDFFSDAGVTKLSITPSFYANGFVGGLGEVSPVPEPSAVAVAIGLFGLVGWRERRKASVSRRAGLFAQ